MRKTEISDKILKRNFFFTINTLKTNQHTSRLRFFQPNMKQLDEAVQAVESDIGFWRPFWILLRKLKNTKKIHQANWANMHTANIQK